MFHRAGKLNLKDVQGSVQVIIFKKKCKEILVQREKYFNSCYFSVPPVKNLLNFKVFKWTTLLISKSLPIFQWFCEACKANVKDPDCELCPNRGGIFKETDVGKWVHLVCALYVPGVAFGEVDQLSMVTLFEMQYSKWGGKLCSLCIDERFARTGVCIGCDAGMCKTYFHVTWWVKIFKMIVTYLFTYISTFFQCSKGWFTL